MSTHSFASSTVREPPGDYLAAMADIEQRAHQGQLTMAQLRHEIHALRERLGLEATTVARWAVPGC